MNASFPEIDLSEELIRRFDVSGPRYTSYPTADRFSADFTQDSYIGFLEQRKQDPSKNPPLSIYVHLPFCESLCYFCACNKIVTKDHSRSAEYLTYLEKEMVRVVQHIGPDRRTAQLHFGGGTPTFLNPEELAKLMGMLREHFEFLPDAERSIEIDPRTVSEDTMAALAAYGFNRTSFGVQDFDAGVQQSVNRIQPYDMVETAVTASRSAGFVSVNADLIYGLPKQSLESFNRTLDGVVKLSPDRIALYNYAHLPHRFKAQTLIVESELPSAETRLQIFMLAMRRLLEAGYVYIGLDHFSKPNDELNLARLNGSLHRNFQGYTTRADCDMISFGVSAIGKVGRCYSQSVHTVNPYYKHLDAGNLPVEKGIILTDDDVLRRKIITQLMCSVPVRFAAIGAEFGIEFGSYFAKELETLKQYQDAGLIAIDSDSIQVTPKGRLFVRASAMVFDNWLSKPTTSKYSKLI